MRPSDAASLLASEVIGRIANEVSEGQLRTEAIFSDEIPDIRRSRRRTRTTKIERILVMTKVSQPHKTLVEPKVAEERLAYALTTA